MQERHQLQDFKRHVDVLDRILGLLNLVHFRDKLLADGDKGKEKYEKKNPNVNE